MGDTKHARLAISQDIGPFNDGEATDWTIEQGAERCLTLRVRGDRVATGPLVERIVKSFNECAHLTDAKLDGVRYALERYDRMVEEQRQDSQTEYDSDVETIAVEIHSDYPDKGEDYEGRVEAIDSAVNGNSWIIRPRTAQLVPGYSQNSPDDLGGMIDTSNVDWSRTVTMAAFLCMRQDVYDALRGLDDDADARLSDLEDDVMDGTIVLQSLPAPSARGRWRVTYESRPAFVVHDDGDVHPDSDDPPEVDAPTYDDLPMRAALAIARKIDEPEAKAVTS